MESAQQAKEAGCSAVCFPEGFLTGYDPGHAQEYAIPQDDPTEDFGRKPTLLFFDVGPALLQRYRSEDPSMKYRYFPAKRRPVAILAIGRPAAEPPLRDREPKEDKVTYICSDRDLDSIYSHA